MINHYMMDNFGKTKFIKVFGESEDGLGIFKINKLVLKKNSTLHIVYGATRSHLVDFEVKSLIADTGSKVYIYRMEGIRNKYRIAAERGIDASGQPSYGATGYSGGNGYNGKPGEDFFIDVNLGITTIPQNGEGVEFCVLGCDGQNGGDGGTGGIGGGGRNKKMKWGSTDYNGGDGGSGGNGGSGGDGGNISIKVDWHPNEYDTDEIASYGMAYSTNVIENSFFKVSLINGKGGLGGKAGFGGQGHPGSGSTQAGRTGVSGNGGNNGSLGNAKSNVEESKKLGKNFEQDESKKYINLEKNIKKLEKFNTSLEILKNILEITQTIDIESQKSDFTKSFDSITENLNGLLNIVEPDNKIFIENLLSSVNFMRNDVSNTPVILELIKQLKVSLRDLLHKFVELKILFAHDTLKLAKSLYNVKKREHFETEISKFIK